MTHETHATRALDMVAKSLREGMARRPCPKCGLPGDPRLLGLCYACAASKWGDEGQETAQESAEMLDRPTATP